MEVTDKSNKQDCVHPQRELFYSQSFQLKIGGQWPSSGSSHYLPLHFFFSMPDVVKNYVLIIVCVLDLVTFEERSTHFSETNSQITLCFHIDHDHMLAYMVGGRLFLKDQFIFYSLFFTRLLITRIVYVWGFSITQAQRDRKLRASPESVASSCGQQRRL